MLGLFGLLNLGSNALATQQQGVEITGHNLANVNNPAYARQRLSIGTAPSVPSDVGPQGTGIQSSAIVQIRSAIVDLQIQDESSAQGSLEAQQSALRFAQADLGQELDTVSGAGIVGTSHSIADDLAGMFNSFQSLSTNPSSLSERQNVLSKASELASKFNQVDKRLAELNGSLNTSVQTDTDSANSLLSQIASLNDQISKSEIVSNGTANDLRDTRQARLEELAKLVKIDVADGGNGTLNVSIAGTLMVSSNARVESLQTFDAGGGQLLVQAAGAATPLALTGGSIQGTIEARDGAIASLRAGLNNLAGVLINEVNTIHSSGYALDGSTGAAFFTGTNASDIRVNPALTDDPTLIQAAGVSGAKGDNAVALKLAQLGETNQASLGGQTFGQGYGETATAFGQALSSVNGQLSDQKLVQKMLLQQRESTSGVSMDEELTNLTLFQRAFQASARLITTVDEMLNTVVNLKQ